MHLPASNPKTSSLGTEVRIRYTPALAILTSCAWISASDHDLREGDFDDSPVDSAASDTDTDTDADTDTQPTSGGTVVINEILADPDFADVNCDGNASNASDEFIEIVNNSELPIDLAFAELRNNRIDRLMHTFGPDNSALEPGEAIVLFGGGIPRFHSGPNEPYPWCGSSADSVKVAVANGDVFNLSETLGESMTLSAADGMVLDHVEFGISEAGNGVSIVRDPELSYGDFVQHNSVSLSDFSFSPGTRVDGDAF